MALPYGDALVVLVVFSMYIEVCSSDDIMSTL